MTLLADYARVSRARLCPICERPDWCLVSRDDPPSKVICSRIESKTRFGEAGWLHVLRQAPWRVTSRTRTVIVRTAVAIPDLAEMAEGFQDCVNALALERLASELGLTVASLSRLRIGWNGCAWTFPMTDVAGRVRGIRVRLPDGRKLAVRGGHDGLFIPSGLTWTDLLLVCEGPTDTAALLDLGFDAIGRPSCSGGMHLLVNVVRAKKPPTLVIVADSDEPGQRGAGALASQLLPHCRDIRVLTPPLKDARAWVNTGASQVDVVSAISALQPTWLVVPAGESRP